MNELNIPSPVWIASDAELENICQHWLQEPFLALDTEFIRTSTFYPIAGLFQVADSQHCYLIDPLLIKDWHAFKAVLTAPKVVKVFHACPEDLEVCRRLTGVLPSPLADTQLAAAYVGHGSNIGFQRLLETILGLHLPKEETRSNWLQRPLSDNQITYAVADVHFLYQIYPKLIAQLKELGREHWLEEDCQKLLKQSDKAEQPEHYFSRFKQMWKLKPQQLYLLKELSLWREHQARSENVPRNNIIPSDALWNMAYYKANSQEQMIKSGVKPYLAKKYSSELIPFINQLLTAEKNLWPSPVSKPFSISASKCFKQLKKTIKTEAEALNIPAELLAGKKSLELMLRDALDKNEYILAEGLRGWREDAIGHKLLTQLQTTTCDHTETMHDENTM